MSRELALADSGDTADEDAQFAFQDQTSDLIIKASLFLDRVMNKIWDRHHAGAPESKKANVYFPAYESREKFDDALRRMQLVSLAERAPTLENLLWHVQPGASAEAAWLGALKKTRRFAA